jgi:CMP-N,N'-diacetyllegionaminic acid synthase
MNIACIIPARRGSKGIPNKNIINVEGKPLLVWSIEQALAIKSLENKIFVSSDCDEILSVASNAGAHKIKRPKDISGDTASSESALIHALDIIEEKLGKLDFIVFLQATSPLREPIDIENAILEFMKGRYDSLFSATLLEDFFIWKKNNLNKLVSFNYDFKSRKPRQEIEPQYVENGSIYIFKPSLLRTTLNRLGGEIGVSIMESWKIHEIDLIDDIDLCEYYIRKKIIKSGENNEL